MNRIGILSSAAGLWLALSLGRAMAQPSITIQPGTPEAANAIKTLSRARDRDRLDARSYTSGDDSEARTAYYSKAREAQDLIDRLEAKNSITSTELAHALDNRAAKRYTEGY